MATMSTVMEAQHHGVAPQPTEFGSEPRPPLPSSALVLRRSGSECLGSSSFVDPGPVELPEQPSDDRVPLPAPPPSVPARKTSPYTKNPRVFRVDPKVHIEMSKRLAKGVLKDYNKTKKIKFELLDVVPVIGVPESHRMYTHMNFTARPTKEGSQEQLFFAEIYHCVKRRAKNGFHVTCCEPLGPDSTAGSRFLKHDGAAAVRKNVDFAYCFACTERILHPKGEKYIAGHRTIPNIYGNPCPVPLVLSIWTKYFVLSEGNAFGSHVLVPCIMFDFFGKCE